MPRVSHRGSASRSSLQTRPFSFRAIDPQASLKRSTVQLLDMREELRNMRQSRVLVSVMRPRSHSWHPRGYAAEAQRGEWRKTKARSRSIRRTETHEGRKGAGKTRRLSGDDAASTGFVPNAATTYRSAVRPQCRVGAPCVFRHYDCSQPGVYKRRSVTLLARALCAACVQKGLL